MHERARMPMSHKIASAFVLLVKNVPARKSLMSIGERALRQICLLSQFFDHPASQLGLHLYVQLAVSGQGREPQT